MLIIINQYAASGKSISKWRSFEPFLNGTTKKKTISLITDSEFNDKQIQESISNGEKEFVAAGGDGTINYLLNSIMEYPDQEALKHVKLGAIGLGSSNDFHKPFKNVLDNIPYRINFAETRDRDVGILKYADKNTIVEKYFLINASLGLTAFGNYIFNHPNKILANLKKWGPSLAIYYAALKSIRRYNNIDAKIDFRNGGLFESKISNLGIVKNPNFSGDLSYSSRCEYDNGLFNVHLAENLNKIKSIFLLWKLSNRNAHNNLIKTWMTEELSVSADKEFHVEFDGETITTASVQFGILPQKIMVCES